MCVIAGAAGAVAGGIGSLASAFGGGSTSTPQTNSNGSLGQGVGNILAGGLSSALGIQGLAGGNANQLQAGAAAANPFGSQSAGYDNDLAYALQGGLAGQINDNQGNIEGLISQLMGSAGINTGAQNVNTKISTPTQTNQLQSLLNNPTQLISSLQGGGVQTPSSISSILSQNPYSLTSGEQFQEQQGLGALNTSLAATGQVGSGNQMVAAEQYGQNFASQATQQNITNLLNAQSTVNQTSTTNQGLQGVVNQMGQNQVSNNLNVANLLSGQQQNTASNTLQQQNLLSQQQQNTQTNLQNLLSQLIGSSGQQTSQLENLIPGLLTATQASSSSPAAAGGILSNLGVANQTSAGNVASGLSGLGSGIGQLLSAGSFSTGASGSENTGASSTSTPDDLISGFTD